MTDILIAEILEVHVPARLRGAARDALEMAGDLELGPVTVRYWNELPPGSKAGVPKTIGDDVAGWIDRRHLDTINLIVDRHDGYAAALSTALHEARHIWQERTYKFIGPEGEADCEQYVASKTTPPGLWSTVQLIS